MVVANVRQIYIIGHNSLVTNLGKHKKNETLSNFIELELFYVTIPIKAAS